MLTQSQAQLWYSFFLRNTVRWKLTVTVLLMQPEWENQTNWSEIVTIRSKQSAIYKDCTSDLLLVVKLYAYLF